MSDPHGGYQCRWKKLGAGKLAKVLSSPATSVAAEEFAKQPEGARDRWP
ncbi:hypothetical protein [Arthrobacter sp. GAS37]